MKQHRFGIVAIVLGAALALSGCASGTSTEAASSAASTPTTAPAAGECAGVQVVVDFGELGGDALDECVETDQTLTAAEAFAEAGIELSESEAFAGAVCRVAGAPAADTELEFEGETYREDCVNMGPVWAYWGLFIDTGDGWGYAQEGASTQQLEPGQGIAFAWQFGDTTEPRLPEA